MRSSVLGRPTATVVVMPTMVLMRWRSHRELAAVDVGVLGQHLATHLDRVEVALARDDELVLAGELAVAEDDLLDLRGKDIHAADDQHVVERP